MRGLSCKWSIRLIRVARAVAVGLAYYVVVDIPGLTSSFVAVFVALLPFDLIVSMSGFSMRLAHWKDLFLVLVPRISGTALTLVKGLVLGGLFGTLTLVGLPIYFGAILTIGLAYHIGEHTRGNISSYVGILAGLALFEQITALRGASNVGWAEIANAGLGTVYGTFTALVLGWAAGVTLGVFTRLLLPRGFRTIHSAAYEQPLSMRPLKDVMHVGDDMVLLRVQVEASSPLANKDLAACGLRSGCCATVLTILRNSEKIVAPQGRDVIFPGDELLIITAAPQMEVVLQLGKGVGVHEQN